VAEEVWMHGSRLTGFAMRRGAQSHGVLNEVQMEKIRVDDRWQWSQVANIWQNAALRTGVYLMLTPARWVLARTP
jgi:hypothetical protein